MSGNGKRRSEDAEDTTALVTSRNRKKQKYEAARTIAVQQNAVAGPSNAPKVSKESASQDG
jgi:hypothetical protein